MRKLGSDRTASGEAFWRFSLALYARPGVAAALIALQERAALDVNLILFGLWLGTSKARLLSADERAEMEAAVAPLVTAAVAPFRRSRRELKPASDPDIQALRRRIATLEIDAERCAQYRLAALNFGVSGEQSKGDRMAIAEANLALILAGEASSLEAGVLRLALGGLIRRA